MDKVDDKGFENAWFSSFAGKDQSTALKANEPLEKGHTSASDALTHVRDFAYSAFDRLDTNGNGFIELAELMLALRDPSLTEREKSFISFLLSNHEQIAASFDEGMPTNKGISRHDLEAYFAIVLNLL